jgi:hypothetical protein
MRRPILFDPLPIFLAALLFPTVGGAAESGATGFVEHSYMSPIDDSRQPFTVFVPKAYDPAKRWPLILFLHGAGEGENARRPTEVGLPVRQRMDDFPFLVAYPFGLYPHLWAALAPVCGRGDVALAANGLHLPLWAFYGAADTAAPVTGSREMVARFRELKHDVRYSEYPGVGHSSWDRAYVGDDLYTWFLSHRRVSRPERVCFRTESLRHARAYWLTILSLHDYGQPGSVEALFDSGAGTLTVRGENVETVYIDRAQTPLDQFRVVIAGSVQRVIEGKGPAQGARLPADLRRGAVKRPGLSGPIEDVFHDRVLFVVGTRGTEAETAGNEAAAKRAANWGRTVHASFRIVRDRDVPREEIRRSHLILFGGPATNRLAAELDLDRQPVRLSAGGAQVGGRTFSAASPGLLAVYPNPRTTNSDTPRYVLLCDAADPDGLLAMAARLARPREVARYDWVLLDTAGGSSTDVLSRGWFDGNWQIIPAAPEPARVPRPPGRLRWPKPIVARGAWHLAVLPRNETSFVPYVSTARAVPGRAKASQASGTRPAPASPRWSRTR